LASGWRTWCSRRQYWLLRSSSAWGVSCLAERFHGLPCHSSERQRALTRR
jgi:hypothetical protein